MRRVPTILLEAIGALVAAVACYGVVALVSALVGCARPVPTPPVAAPVVAPNGDTDDCPGGVCHLPGAMK